MNPEGTIELLKGMQNQKVDYAKFVGAPAFAYRHSCVYPEPEDYAIQEAIEVIKEIQQYRKIGTIEECREAIERQIPKKPNASIKIDPVIDENGAYIDADTIIYLRCPNCGKIVGIEDNCDKFCCECGQAIAQEIGDDRSSKN